MLFVGAWAAGQAIVIYRWARLGAPPTPGALLLPSVIFVGLAVLAGYAPAKGTATALAIGVDVAVLLQVLGKAPTGTTGWPPPVMDNAATSVFPSGPGSQAGTPASGSAPPSAYVPPGSRGAAGGIAPPGAK